MKTFLVSLNERRKPVLQRDLLAGELKGRTPCAAPLGHANQSWPRRIGDSIDIRRPWFKIWSALAFALVATPSHAQNELAREDAKWRIEYRAQSPDELHLNDEFLFVTNQGEAVVSGYEMEVCSGELTPIAGSPFAAGRNPMSVAVEPSGGNFVYVANKGDHDVSGYTLNPSSGALKPIAGSPFVVETHPVSVVVDPNDRFAYVVTGQPPSSQERKSNISGYAISPTTGELTAIAGSSLEIAGTGISVALDPNGKFAYVTTFLDGTGNILGYTINPSTGALTAMPPLALPPGPTPSSVAVDPSGKFVYVTNEGSGFFFSNSVFCFAINPTTGSLGFINSFATGVAPSSVAVDPSGKFVYVTNESSDNVSGYTINPSTGALTAIAGSPFPAGRSPRSVAVDPGDRFAYVANFGSDSISGYDIDASTGALRAMAGSPFATSGEPSSVAIWQPPP